MRNDMELRCTYAGKVRPWPRPVVRLVRETRDLGLGIWGLGKWQASASSLRYGQVA